ncbi:MalY/PatB family protein [Listeria costaricensis]|uniref:MalY/PatB family protein n=1 Tax=Listeria costaricensis TaxID=2026604 RepID=UPI000C07965E|nr:MalY/PatB family protein [Listeria costaricensis]
MSQFDEVIPRLGTDSEKWDGAEELFGRKGIIPMWVADMDFRAPKPVLEAFKERVEHGVFGYSAHSDQVKEAIINWNARRHQFHFKKEDLLFNTAVVPSISLALRVLTNEGDAVLMHSPIYPPFFNVTRETKRKVVMSPLKYENNRLHIDLADMEERIQRENVKLFILCNPQNPGGRAWSLEELTQMVALCKKYQIPIVSDEIHADLVVKSRKHYPLVVAAPDYQDQIVTLMAPTKTFNLAAIKASYLVITNEQLRDRFKEFQRYEHAAGLNVFGLIGMETAYNEGEDWLDELRDYIYSNYEYVKEALKKEVPEIGVTELEATYLMWLDARALPKDEKTLYQDIIDAGCGVQMGSGFGKSSSGFIRLNIACPKETLEKGVAALIAGIKK